MRFLLSIILACGVLQALPLHAEESAAELEAQGIAALKLSQTQPDAVVMAAVQFGKAVESYEKAGNEAKATEMNSYLFWCRKKMSLEQIDVFLKGGDAALAAVADRLKALEKAAPKAGEARAYFDRADAYAKAHPDEHMLIAVRFFEVAERFKGAAVSVEAQDRSLKEMMLAGQAPSVPQATVEPKPAPPVLEKKLPVPVAAQLKEAEKTIREIFKDELAKSAPADKLELARKLMAQAADSPDDPAARYELLVMSANLAAEAFDIHQLFMTLDKLSAGFEGDFIAQKKTALGLIADRAKDSNVSKLAQSFLTLMSKPDNAQSNQMAGKYYCFTEGDFERGIPHLAKAASPVLSALAKQDLANPQDAAAQVNVGDAWWDAGEKATDKDEKRWARERAGFWYAKALPTVTGLHKARLEKRLAAVGISAETAPIAQIRKPIDLLKLIDPARDALKGDWEMDRGQLVCKSFLNEQLIEINYKPGMEYDFHTVFERSSANPERDVAVILVYGNQQVRLTLCGWHNVWAGLHYINGKFVVDNVTRTPNQLKDNTPYDLIAKIRRDSISVLLNGKNLINYMPGNDKLSLDNAWKPRDAQTLGLSCNECSVRFKVVEITEAPIDQKTAIAQPREPSGNSQTKTISSKSSFPPSPGTVESSLKLAPNVKLDLVQVRAGQFKMGADDADAHDYEHPLRTITMTKIYWIGKYPVTVAQFRCFVDETKYQTTAEKENSGNAPSDYRFQKVTGVNWRQPGYVQDDSYPVVLVDWNDASAFCAWLTQKTKRLVRLPCEAEWEYAARGPQSLIYPWGNTWDGTKANHLDQSIRNAGVLYSNMDYSTDNDGFVYTAPVGSFDNASWCGAFDMSGNTTQWVSNWYNYTYRFKGPAVDPVGPPIGEKVSIDTKEVYVRVVKGGNWANPSREMRSSGYRSHVPDFRSAALGFRIAVQP